MSSTPNNYTYNEYDTTSYCNSNSYSTNYVNNASFSDGNILRPISSHLSCNYNIQSNESYTNSYESNYNGHSEIDTNSSHSFCTSNYGNSEAPINNSAGISSDAPNFNPETYSNGNYNYEFSQPTPNVPPTNCYNNHMININSNSLSLLNLSKVQLLEGKHVNFDPNRPPPSAISSSTTLNIDTSIPPPAISRTGRTFNIDTSIPPPATILSQTSNFNISIPPPVNAKYEMVYNDISNNYNQPAPPITVPINKFNIDYDTNFRQQQAFNHECQNHKQNNKYYQANKYFHSEQERNSFESNVVHTDSYSKYSRHLKKNLYHRSDSYIKKRRGEFSSSRKVDTGTRKCSSIKEPYKYRNSKDSLSPTSDHINEQYKYRRNKDSLSPASDRMKELYRYRKSNESLSPSSDRSLRNCSIRPISKTSYSTIDSNFKHLSKRSRSKSPFSKKSTVILYKNGFKRKSRSPSRSRQKKHDTVHKLVDPTVSKLANDKVKFKLENREAKILKNFTREKLDCSPGKIEKNEKPDNYNEEKEFDSEATPWSRSSPADLYYRRDIQNPTVTRATNKLILLCEKFEEKLVKRAQRAREIRAKERELQKELQDNTKGADDSNFNSDTEVREINNEALSNCVEASKLNCLAQCDSYSLSKETSGITNICSKKSSLNNDLEKSLAFNDGQKSKYYEFRKSASLEKSDSLKERNKSGKCSLQFKYNHCYSDNLAIESSGTNICSNQNSLNVTTEQTLACNDQKSKESGEDASCKNSAEFKERNESGKFNSRSKNDQCDSDSLRKSSSVRDICSQHRPNSLNVTHGPVESLSCSEDQKSKNCKPRNSASCEKSADIKERNESVKCNLQCTNYQCDSDSLSKESTINNIYSEASSLNVIPEESSSLIEDDKFKNYEPKKKEKSSSFGKSADLKERSQSGKCNLQLNKFKIAQCNSDNFSTDISVIESSFDQECKLKKSKKIEKNKLFNKSFDSEIHSKMEKCNSRINCSYSKNKNSSKKVTKKVLKKPRKGCLSDCSSSDSDDFNENNSSSSSCASEDEEWGTKGLEEMEKKKKHPDRMHEELWFNDPGEMIDYPLCRCSMKARRSGIRHGYYVGEEPLRSCDMWSNSADKLHHYLIAISPPTNFLVKTPTIITHDSHEFIFEGFSLLSHYPLENIPICQVIRFNIEYSVYCVKDKMPDNFCIKELNLFYEYLFEEILELVDLNFKAVGDENGCPRFHFLPRFVRKLPDNGKEVLSMNEVLNYLLKSSVPLVKEEELSKLIAYSERDWLNFTDQAKGMIVTYPGKKPCSIRLDQLDREQVRESTINYPVIVHFGIRPPQLSYAGNPLYQKALREYVKFRHLLANMPKPSYEHKRQLEAKENRLQEMRLANVMKKEVTVDVSSEGFLRTGIMCDISQHALLIPVLVRHLRFHRSLTKLEETINYHFKDQYLLQLALTHPSYRENYGTNPDHARITLTNCGVRQPKYGDKSIQYMNTHKHGIDTLVNIMSRFGKKEESASKITHNERLEFLGDAVVEFLCSIHLFHLFPALEEGGLATYRAALVQNKHLSVLAEKLELDKYVLHAHGSDLCHTIELRHAMANCFEALMGAIFIDSRIESTGRSSFKEADTVFSETLFKGEPQLLDVWVNYKPHPLQEQEPDGDRKWIETFPLLQKIVKFEESIGIKFKHVRLLARSFTDRSIGFNYLTLGSNQRLEFLGDTVLQLIASEYLYKYFPEHHEGHLSLLRSSLVNNRTQAVVCDELNMTEYAIYSKLKTELKTKDRADLLEAFLGALYIDQGLDHCRTFCDVCFFPRLQQFIINQEWNDPKSKLQQCCLTLRSMAGGEPDIPIYKVIECKGPTNTRVYTVAVYFRNKRLSKASGHSIQTAEMLAAENALINNEDLFPQLAYQKRLIAKILERNAPFQDNLSKTDENVSLDSKKSGCSVFSASRSLNKSFQCSRPLGGKRRSVTSSSKGHDENKLGHSSNTMLSNKKIGLNSMCRNRSNKRYSKFSNKRIGFCKSRARYQTDKPYSIAHKSLSRDLKFTNVGKNKITRKKDNSVSTALSKSSNKMDKDSDGTISSIVTSKARNLSKVCNKIDKISEGAVSSIVTVAKIKEQRFSSDSIAMRVIVDNKRPI